MFVYADYLYRKLSDANNYRCRTSFKKENNKKKFNVIQILRKYVFVEFFFLI